MHDGMGTCISYFNDAINMLPVCTTVSPTVTKWQYDEQLCLGYAHNLDSVYGGVLMSDTFVFPFLDIVSQGLEYKLACVRVIFRRQHTGHIDDMLAVFVH